MTFLWPLAALWLTAFPLAAQPLTAEQQTYVVGVEDLPYYPHYHHDKGEFSGIARAIFDAFAKDENHQFVYRALPVKRLFQELVEGKIDFKYPDNAYWSADLKRSATIYYSEPMVEYIDGVMVLPERQQLPLGELRVLGLPAGFTAWDYLDFVNAGQIKIYENSSFSGLLQQAMRRRVDGAYLNISVAAYQLETQLKQPGALVFNPNLPYTRSAYRLSSPKNPALIQQFNAWMVRRADFLERLKDEYRVRLAPLPTAQTALPRLAAE